MSALNHSQQLLVRELVAGAFEIEAFGERSPASRIDGCAYDRGRQRILL